MRALYYPSWQNLKVVQDLPIPTPGRGEVLVRVSHCGICGSELETFQTQNARRMPPLIMGHEFCGHIEDVNGTKSTWSGRRAIAHAVIHCGNCPACLRGDTNLCSCRQIFGMHRPGGFAEYVVVPERVLIPWPETMPGATAVFAEPLANGINAMRQGPHARKSRVVVIGAGPIGLMCVLAAKHIHRSTVVVSDLVPERLDAARIVGADVTVHAAKQNLANVVRDYWSNDGVEFVIDAVGSSETKRLSLELVQPGGMVVWVGLHQDQMSLNSYAVTLGQKCVSGSYSGSMQDLLDATKLLDSGILNTSWVTQYALEHGDVGFRHMLLGKGHNIKGVLDCN